MNVEFIEITKLIMVASWLTFMALIDIHNARIPEKYLKWFLTMSFGFILFNLQNPIPVAISVGITILFTQLLYKFKAIGGADIGILIILSLLYPINIHYFPFTLLVFAVAGIGVGIYGMIKADQNNKTLMDIKDLRVPFVPFLLAGYLAVIITAF
jgi:Flp pilus assembly protein protease CpaA